MDKLAAMGAFTKVVASGSYAEAARRLGLTRSAVSKAVSELEDELGARLLDRTTRRVTPTEAGLAYYERCLAILAQVEETEAQVSRLHDQPKGVLRVNAPMSFGMMYLSGAIAGFMQTYADLKVELTLTDRFIDPLEEGVDVTIRVGALDDSSLIARRIGSTALTFVASPAYLQAHGEPQSPADLTHHRALIYGHSTAAQRWKLKDGSASISTPVNGCLASNNGDVLRDAAVAGIGIARLPVFLVCNEIRAGTLREVLAPHVPNALDIHALYAPNRYLAAKTRVFIDYLIDRFGKVPPWQLEAPNS
jgi:DNA-binding transcriptional LysR family regulator